MIGGRSPLRTWGSLVLVGIGIPFYVFLLAMGTLATGAASLLARAVDGARRSVRGRALP